MSKLIKIEDKFNVYNGNSLELNGLEENKSSNINFISRTSTNNGVIAKVNKIDSIEPYKAGLITVALGGSVLSSFVQQEPFYTAYHIKILEPKSYMSINEKLFYCMAIKNNAYRYSYGRQANKTLNELLVPSDVPDWAKKINIDYSKIKTKKTQITLPIDVQNWNSFKIKDLFDLTNCKCSNATDLLENGEDIFYIGAKKNDNGIMKKVKIVPNLVTKGNCIVFICDGQGSVGYSLYMDKDFIGSTTLSVGYNKNLNKYNGLFLVSILDKERAKYSFGRKYRKHLSNTKIKLPVNKSGEPDWTYMENYIKSLPNSDLI